MVRLTGLIEAAYHHTVFVPWSLRAGPNCRSHAQLFSGFSLVEFSTFSWAENPAHVFTHELGQ